MEPPNRVGELVDVFMSEGVDASVAYILSLLGGGVYSLAGIVSILSDTSERLGSRPLIVDGFFVETEEMIKSAVLAIAQYVLDVGGSLAEYVEILQEAFGDNVRDSIVEICAKYLGYEWFIKYCVQSDYPVNPVRWALLAAYEESYDRLVRVVGFYQKYGMSCLDLLSNLGPLHLYVKQRRAGRIDWDTNEPILAIIIIELYDWSFEDLLEQAQSMNDEGLYDYLVMLADSGV